MPINPDFKSLCFEFCARDARVAGKYGDQRV